jgi:hypothetical protein
MRKKQTQWRRSLSTKVAQFFLLAILCLASDDVHAQVFPIQVNTQVSPPYSPFLSDYTAPGSQYFMTQIRINDPGLNEFQVKLRLTIEGLGITIKTKPTFIPQPITLEGVGIPLILYGEDLLEYFNPNNLDFAGYSRKEFQKTGKLPEGAYRFVIEVLAYNRGTVLSNPGAAVVWMILNDPPLLNLPRKDAKVKIVDPTNIVFTWTPRHTGSPNAAFSTEYIFRLVEIWPVDRNPYDAFLSQPTLYEASTTQSQIIYGLAEPALIPGRSYAWQVQATDVDGRDLFKNQGKSEVFVFQFGDELGIPENLRNEAASASSLSLRWEPSSVGEMPLVYRVRYKKANSDKWSETTTQQNWVNLQQLVMNTSYDIQVRGEKGKRHGEFTTILKATTPALNPVNDFKCGSPTTTPPNVGVSSLLSLTPGDVVTINDFRIVVTEVLSSAVGSYAGKGLMAVNLFNKASIKVAFNGTINKDYQMTSGGYESTYTAGSAMGQVIDEMHKIGEEKPEDSKTDEHGEELEATYVVEVEIVSVTVGDDGKIVVTDEEGNETEYEQKKDEKTKEIQPTIIEDKSGDQWIVQKDPKTGETTITKNESGLPGTGGNRSASTDTQIIRPLAIEVVKSFRSDLSTFLNISIDAARLGAGPMRDIFAAGLPSTILRYKDDDYSLRAVFDYCGDFQKDKQLQIDLENRLNSNASLNALIDKNKESFKIHKESFEQHIDSEDWNRLKELFGEAVVEESLTTFYRDHFKDSGYTLECLDRGASKFKEEFFKVIDLKWALFASSLEISLCYTEENKCAGLGESDRFAYGLVNGLLLQLNIPEMRDALIELLKRTTGNKFDCFLNAEDILKQLSSTNDPKVIIRILTKCFYGIEVNVDEIATTFNLVWEYVKTNYQNAYFQGQATAFIITIVLPPVIKAIQSVKLAQLLRNARPVLLARVRQTGGFVELETVLDDASKGFDDVVNVVKVYRNVPFDDFGKTVPEFANGANKQLAEKAYQLWGEQKWDDLYKLFDENNFNGKWPPNNGVIEVVKKEGGNQLAGKTFDRFQKQGDIGGSYASPVYQGEGLNDLYFTYDSRSLVTSVKTEGLTYIKFKFREKVPTHVEFEYGEIIPWWGRNGLGDQIKSSVPLRELWNNGDGVIEIIEKLEYRNGQWVKIN